MVLNNVTKFHKILIKNIQVRERTSFKTVNFHKQRAITTENLVRYGPLSNLKKTFSTKQFDQASLNSDQKYLI